MARRDMKPVWVAVAIGLLGTALTLTAVGNYIGALGWAVALLFVLMFTALAKYTKDDAEDGE